MKKCLLIALLAYISNWAEAQSSERMFKKFKGEVSLGYDYFPASEIKNGFTVALEPHWVVVDQLSLGLRSQTVLQFKDYTIDDPYSSYSNLRIKTYSSLNVTADYYFTNDYNLRPFAGIGGGVQLVNIDNTDFDYSTSDDGGSTKVTGGGFFRAGMEIKHFRMAIEYNFVGKTKTPYYDYYLGRQVDEVSKNSYLSVKFGFCFGGGPINNSTRKRR